MATSHCSVCGGTDFEISESLLHPAEAKIAFVQCSTCGSVMGVVRMEEGKDPSAHGESGRRKEPGAYSVEL